jgi:hypothetical protein
VVVGDGRHFSFGGHLGECKSQGNVHGNGQRVLGDEHIYVELFNELVEAHFQEAAEGMDHVCYHSLSPLSAKSFLLNPFHRIVLEVSLFN